MSDPTSTHEEGPHEGPIKTPKQAVLAAVFGLVVPIVTIGLLVTYVASGGRSGAGSSNSEEDIARRIQPIGAVKMGEAGGAAAVKTGEQVYTAQCAACHGTGAAGAPKFGDSAAWGPRIAQGFEALLNSALKGKNAMPPQAGGEHSDYEIARAVVYMANKGGANFAEPKAPAGAASAPAADAAAQTAAAGAVPALYTQSCATCHGAGIAGAPKLGDKAAWAPRLAQGVDGLTASAIKGKNAMPPRGGSSASDAEIKAVVSYMVSAVK